MPNNQRSTNVVGNVYIRLKKDNGDSEGKYIPLEEALALCFPLLFPFGVLEKIPGNTLREKSRAILSSHFYYRCGRLQCNLILFLYHIIMDHDTAYEQNNLSRQLINIPNGTSRHIPPQKFRSDDPAFPTYWSRRQAEVRTMCSQFGDPDLMLTFTFVNKWPEVENIEKMINDQMFDHLDIRFCPYEEMEIWKSRFFNVKICGFDILIKTMGLGDVEHYTWRLEFQARGAPHVHSLVWLKERVKLETLSKTLFASMPSEETPKLKNLVNGPMVHTCDVNRCKRGIPTALCRYGFPKPASTMTHINEEGQLVLKRTQSDANIVEYSPNFLLKWGGHCHINVLRTKENPRCSPNAVYYIVKYNFKAEPSLRIQMKDESSNFRTAFQGRVISAEEAITKIYSYDYYGSDIASEYISLKPPESRKALFHNGIQVQISNIEKYFSRPKELERIGILTFFSMYEIKACKISNIQRINNLHNTLSGESLREAITKPSRMRQPNTLKDGSNWESINLGQITPIHQGHLYPSSDLPNAKALKCIRRTKPKIIITEKFSCSSNIEEFAYVYLLLSGSWRSDDEMKAGQTTWMKALEYHGLSLPDDDEVMKYNRLLIKYMLNCSRYGEYDISRLISMMNEDMTDFLDELKRNVPQDQKELINKVFDILKCQNQIYNEEQIISLTVEPNPQIINKYIYYSFNEETKVNAKNILINMIRTFNDKQKMIYENIIDRLKGGVQLKAFISGKAGTGKTFLINALKNYFIANSIPFIVCASTGIAASILNGKTVHSAFGLFTKKNENCEDVYCSLDIAKENGYAISFAKIIIIDEVTMISSKVLESLNNGLKKLAAQKNDVHFDLDFGGKNILLFGDLAQVPAVTRAPDDFNESIEQFFKSDVFRGFTRWDLDKIMRQNSDEIEFIQLLDNIRNHSDGQDLNSNVIGLLKERFIPGSLENVIDEIDSFVGRDDPKGMVITFTNRMANEYNHLILLKRLNGDESKLINIDAKFFIDQKSSYMARNTTFNYESELANQREVARIHLASKQEIDIFCGAMRKKFINSIIPFHITIAPNARIMLLQNIDISHGLINGARGTVIEYIPEVDAFNIKFDFQTENEQPILIGRRKSVEYQIHDGKTIFMYQFPLKLAWAVTAHKSQGQTLCKAAIHIGERAFAHGSLYVALSRVKSLRNIRLFGIEEWPENGPIFHMNPYIQDEQDAPIDNAF